jgi:hypothetical protein
MYFTVSTRSAGHFLRACLVAPICCLGVAQAGGPNSDPIQKSTEFGITIEPSHIFDAMEESVDFWPNVRRYVTSDQFTVAEHEHRVAAATFVKRVQDELHGRLFGNDETASRDVVEYITWGLRRAMVYREIREIIDEPRTLVRLRNEFERTSLEARRSNADLDINAMVERMDVLMQPLELSAEQHALAVDRWRVLAECTQKINSTQTSLVIHRADEEAGTVSCGQLVRQIAGAADWALIVKAGKRTTRQDFVNAWHELHDEPVAEVATSAGN